MGKRRAANGGRWGGTPTLQLHAHAGTVTPTALVTHEESHSGTRVPTQAPPGGGSAHGHRAHAAPGPSLWGRHHVSVGTCGDTHGGMVLAGCGALRPGFGGLTRERGWARLPPAWMHTRVHLHTRALVCPHLPHAHSHVPHTLPHCSVPGVPGCAQVEDRGENLGESRGAQGKRERLGQQMRTEDSIPSNRQRPLLRWLRQPPGKAAGSAAAHAAKQPGAGQHLQCRER